MSKPIRVWPFEQAPQAYQDLSPHGGDEDWVALVPPSLRERYIPWIERLGICDTSTHEQEDGSIIYIGAHA